MSLSSLIKRLQDIMRKDSGVDGDGSLRIAGRLVGFGRYPWCFHLRRIDEQVGA